MDKNKVVISPHPDIFLLTGSTVIIIHLFGTKGNAA